MNPPNTRKLDITSHMFEYLFTFGILMDINSNTFDFT